MNDKNILFHALTFLALPVQQNHPNVFFPTQPNFNTTNRRRNSLQLKLRFLLRIEGNSPSSCCSGCRSHCSGESPAANTHTPFRFHFISIRTEPCQDIAGNMRTGHVLTPFSHLKAD
ncbi:hypothetical protein ATANTOWER_014718 [Ataeniobius toweri]|uniref:Secreted protein n=1 Tax=Ataeniobius toweri TaxID=208326 RepID=A0ABU7C1L4_9TELE|nr:hypothetical protein [Ataeniobius toweri]